MYQTDPSGNYYEYKAIAIGARSQSAKTYMEKNYESFPDADIQTLILHALRALQGTTGDDVELNTKNCSVSIVGKGQAYRLIENEDVEPYLRLLEDEDKSGSAQTSAMQD